MGKKVISRPFKGATEKEHASVAMYVEYTLDTSWGDEGQLEHIDTLAKGAMAGIGRLTQVLHERGFITDTDVAFIATARREEGLVDFVEE